jgi:hypothetical protein
MIGKKGAAVPATFCLQSPPCSEIVSLSFHQYTFFTTTRDFYDIKTSSSRCLDLLIHPRVDIG